MFNENEQYTVKQLVELLNTPFSELQLVVFNMQYMDFTRFIINKQLVNCFRLNEIDMDMSLQVPRNRGQTEVVRKIFTEEIDAYVYYIKYKTVDALWKSFHSTMEATMQEE